MAKKFQEVFETMQQYILANDLQAGDLLPSESALCERLGASRNVVREAIKSMELVGMVKAIPGHGTELLPFNLSFLIQSVFFRSVRGTPNAIGEAAQMRKHLELGFMSAAYKAVQPADVLEVRRNFSVMQEYADSETKVFLPIDHEFHMAIFRPLNNQTLISALDALWKIDEAYYVTPRERFRESDLRMHENIVVALESGNREAFEAAMRLHYSAVSFAEKSR